MRFRLLVVVVMTVSLATAGCTSSGGSEFALVANEAFEDPEERLGYGFSGDDATVMAPTLTVKAGDHLTVTLENAHERGAIPTISP